MFVPPYTQYKKLTEKYLENLSLSLSLSLYI